MESREEKIAYIKRRMQELGLKPRTLSMKATGKPDTVRNLTRGLSRNWRQDNYEAIMSVIGHPNAKEELSPISVNISPIEKALLEAMQGIILTIISKPIVKRKDFERVFTHLKQYSKRDNQPAAIEVMNQFLDSLSPQPHQEAAQAIHKLLSHSQT